MHILCSDGTSSHDSQTSSSFIYEIEEILEAGCVQMEFHYDQAACVYSSVFPVFLHIDIVMFNDKCGYNRHLLYRPCSMHHVYDYVVMVVFG